MKMRIIHDIPWKILGYHGIPGLSGPFFFSSFRNGMPWWRDPPPVSIILFGLKGGYGCTQSLQVISWTYSQYYNMYIYLIIFILWKPVVVASSIKCTVHTHIILHWTALASVAKNIRSLASWDSNPRRNKWATIPFDGWFQLRYSRACSLDPLVL